MTTACDALAAGLLVLTVAGDAFPSRVAASLLNAVRFPDGIADSLAAYRERAVRWGRNPAELQELKMRQLADPLNTPLFDTEGRVRQLEKAYQEMWKRYQAGLAPESFNVVAQPDPAWLSPWAKESNSLGAFQRDEAIAQAARRVFVGLPCGLRQAPSASSGK